MCSKGVFMDPMVLTSAATVSMGQSIVGGAHYGGLMALRNCIRLLSRLPLATELVHVAQ